MTGDDLLFTVEKMASITGYNVFMIIENLKNLQLSPEITKFGVNHYSEKSFRVVFDYIEENTFVKYYPMKTTETFFIYESKLNSL